MRVGVIGCGRVGQAVIDLFGSVATVTAFDTAKHDIYPAAELGVADFAVVCVPTPPDMDGSADLGAIHDAMARLPTKRVLLKSTVPPGTTEQMEREYGKQICFWPEYVSESTYANPFFPDKIHEVPFVILGGSPEIRHWFIDRLEPILGPTKRYFQCSSTEAEVIKYMENAFFATKVTFVNEFRNICEALGADWHTVREGWILDPRIGPMHTSAFADSPGYGGKCLPKDIAAIVAAAKSAGYSPDLLNQVIASNAGFRANLASPVGERGQSAIPRTQAS